MPEILVLGAGKIGRGFIAHLAHRSGWRVAFAEAVPALCAALRAAGSYRVDIAGRPEATERIPISGVTELSDAAGLVRAVAAADLLACAVGAPNLAALAAAMAPALAARAGAGAGAALDWLILENADQPAKTIRAALLAAPAAQDPLVAAWLRDRLGLVETQVLRSGMPPEPEVAQAEPLAVRMHDWWTLPADRDAFRGALPVIDGLQARGGFEHELLRKLYTFNGLNGPISYLGWINGYRILHEAARAPELQELLRGCQAESAHGLIGAHGFEPAEHRAFQAIAWEKYRDDHLKDAIERNARDSARKLGARERLIGPASLCLAHGRAPRSYAVAISAAARYRGSDDEGTRAVQAALASGGMAAVLARWSGLAEGSELAALVLDADRRRDWALRPAHLPQGITP
jgi:mannitol-1-phosphate 5-dehydrogenase